MPVSGRSRRGYFATRVRRYSRPATPPRRWRSRRASRRRWICCSPTSSCPGIDGADLAERLRGLKPGLRVLFMSGYTPEELAVTAAIGSKVCCCASRSCPGTLRDRVAYVLAQPSGISI
jgi:hypothetical protein